MVGHELAVQQLKPTNPEPRHQPGQCHLGSVGFAAKHALAKKGPAKRYAIEAAHKPVVPPAFHAVRITHAEKLQAGLLDRRVDPAFRPVGRCLRTGAQHGMEILVCGDAEFVLPDRLAQRTREMNTIERQHRPFFRLHPENFRIFPAVRHREDAHGIGAQQNIEINCHCFKS